MGQWLSTLSSPRRRPARLAMGMRAISNPVKLVRSETLCGYSSGRPAARTASAKPRRRKKLHRPRRDVVAANRQRLGRRPLVHEDHAMAPLCQVDARDQAHGTGAHHEDIAYFIVFGHHKVRSGVLGDSAWFRTAPNLPVRVRPSAAEASRLDQCTIPAHAVPTPERHRRPSGAGFKRSIEFAHCSGARA